MSLPAPLVSCPSRCSETRCAPRAVGDPPRHRSHIFPQPFHVENPSGSQPLVVPALSQQANMAFVKKGRIFMAVVRAEETG